MYVCDGKQKAKISALAQSLFFVEQTQNEHKFSFAIRSLIYYETINAIGDYLSQIIHEL